MRVSKEHGLPRYWEKRVLAAYLLMMGETWDSTASKVGRSHTTIAVWKKGPYWWERAKAEAETRWLYDVKDVARQAVTRQLATGDGDLGVKILERLDEDFSPKMRQEGVSPQVLHLIVQKVLGSLSDDQAQELLDFVATQLAQ
jgi:hypothetical protein